MATQTRNPSSDISASGSWSGSAGTRFQAVDDHPDSGGTDFLTHGTTAGTIIFGFPSFSVPAGSTIQAVRVRYYARRTAGGATNNHGALRVASTNYTIQGANLSTSFELRELEWTQNPDTSAAWTVDQVNGSGGNAIAGFGYHSTDANPTNEVASIQIEVEYTEAGVQDTTATAGAGAGTATSSGHKAALATGAVAAGGQAQATSSGLKGALASSATTASGQAEASSSGLKGALSSSRIDGAAAGTFTTTAAAPAVTGTVSIDAGGAGSASSSGRKGALGIASVAGLTAGTFDAQGQVPGPESSTAVAGAAAGVVTFAGASGRSSTVQVAALGTGVVVVKAIAHHAIPPNFLTARPRQITLVGGRFTA